MADSRFQGNPQFVCIPSAIPAAERETHFALARDLFQRQSQAQEDLPDGYECRFAADAFGPLTRFVANERNCCPAIRFEIVVSAQGGPVSLRMTGPEGVREFLKAELPLR